jgi:hypothetical protein
LLQASVTVEIKTGTCRLIEYLMSPCCGIDKSVYERDENSFAALMKVAN